MEIKYCKFWLYILFMSVHILYPQIVTSSREFLFLCEQMMGPNSKYLFGPTVGNNISQNFSRCFSTFLFITLFYFWVVDWENQVCLVLGMNRLTNLSKMRWLPFPTGLEYFIQSLKSIRFFYQGTNVPGAKRGNVAAYSNQVGLLGSMLSLCDRSVPMCWAHHRFTRKCRGQEDGQSGPDDLQNPVRHTSAGGKYTY